MHFLKNLIPKKSFLLCKDQWPTAETEVPEVCCTSVCKYIVLADSILFG